MNYTGIFQKISKQIWDYFVCLDNHIIKIGILEIIYFIFIIKNFYEYSKNIKWVIFLFEYFPIFCI